eukprot:Amastigsp_a841038_835.p5 type:complete len:113 gc:universal Amastigsp_a841038_835:867-529(-)
MGGFVGRYEKVHVDALTKRISPSPCASDHTPAASWMWPTTETCGLTRCVIVRSRSTQPEFPPLLSWSPMPYAGPCVSSTSTRSGIRSHFAARSGPGSRLNAHSQNSGCHGEP